jgi:hypothetical protein
MATKGRRENNAEASSANEEEAEADQGSRFH